MKIGLITATVLIIIGAVTVILTMAINDWDLSSLDTSKYVNNSYTVSDSFNGITTKTDTADITFLPSDSDTCTVVCYEDEKAMHKVSVEENTLKIDVVNDKKWYDYIGISLKTPTITVYLPKKEYTSLNVKDSTGDVKVSDFVFESIDIFTSTGDIYAENITADSMSLSVSTGDIKIGSSLCNNNITIKSSTGDVRLTDVIAKEKLSVKLSTGDIAFSRCDATEIYVKTSTGDIKGDFLSEKIFVAKSSTGSVRVPQTSTGGKCELATSTGDIKIELK